MGNYRIITQYKFNQNDGVKMEKSFFLNKLDIIANQLDAAHQALVLSGRMIGGEGGSYEIRDEDGVKVDFASIAKDLREISNELEDK